jgi:glycosyltransferase involved in cell wall biosynthesis
LPDSSGTRICLVTEELSFGKGSGGIGGAFHELALALRRAGHSVDLIYLPPDLPNGSVAALVNYYADHGVRIIDANIDRYVWAPYSYEKRSYGLFRYLISVEQPYDFIHFHDYKGLGFCTLAAKSQRIGFASTTLVVQAHGPTRWTLQANDHPFVDESQLQIDFMERESIARADMLVSPSRYMLKWLEQNHWVTPPADRVRVIQNICSHISTMLGSKRERSAAVPSNEIVFFGRHEERKGIIEFCDALDRIAEELANRNVIVTLLGGFGLVGGEASALFLARRARNWRFPMRLLPDSDRIAACRAVAANDRAVVVIPSRIENSPYTVVEAAILGKPLITSALGGTSELLDPAQTEQLTCAIDHESLAARLLAAVQTGLPAARLAIAPAKTEKLWLDLHAAHPKCANLVAEPAASPKVVAVVTHFERPAKLHDAVLSLAGQLYANLEIVVVDDGSRDPTTLELLERMQPLLDKLNVRLLRQPNRYLGAARNHAIAKTNSDYILFLDDDDIAFPNLVQTLVTVAEATTADIVNCLQLYMHETRRGEAYPFPDRFREKVSYVPTGGPLAIAPLDNCFGGSTVLLRRTSVLQLGNYTEDYGVGHEDYELYARALQAGMRIEICPLPLVLYEVGRPSMLTTTSRLRNWNRIARIMDPTQNPEAWRDLASLTAGRRAMEHVNNYGEWWRGNDPQSDLLRRIVHSPVDSADYAYQLQEYAAGKGATSYANALGVLAISRAAEAGAEGEIMMPPLLNHATAAQPLHSDLDALMLGALIDLSADNTHRAILTFLVSWEREPGSLSEAQLRFLRALARRDSLAPQDAGRVLDLLKQKSSGLDELRTLIPIMFRLALLARDMPTAVAIVDRALVVDEQSYLATQPDAAEQVSTGLYKSALDHFVRSAGAKGDEIFPLLHELKSALRTLMGVEIPIASLRPYVISLAQGHVATSTTTNESLLPVTSKPRTNGSGMQLSRRAVSRHTVGVHI